MASTLPCMDHTGSSHWPCGGHLSHHLWCAHSPHTNHCPHWALVHESLVGGSHQAVGSLVCSLVWEETSISFGTRTWHHQNLLVADSVESHHTGPCCNTVLVVGGVQDLLGRPHMLAIIITTWHDIVQRLLLGVLDGQRPSVSIWSHHSFMLWSISVQTVAQSRRMSAIRRFWWMLWTEMFKHASWQQITFWMTLILKILHI